MEGGCLHTHVPLFRFLFSLSSFPFLFSVSILVCWLGKTYAFKRPGFKYSAKINPAIMSSLDVSAIKLGALQVSAKGAKQVSIFDLHDRSIFLQLGPLSALFEPSAFNDPSASRVNLCLSTNEVVEETLQKLDNRIIELLAAESCQYFGTALTSAQVLERMQPSIRVSDKGYKSCRLKMNVSGRARVALYDMNRQPREAPESWVGASCTAKVLIKSVWFLAKEFGILYEAQAVQLDVQPAECPF